MPEFEELRLKVVLEDQASAQLAQIKTQLSQMGGGESQQGFERVRSNTSALTPIMRSMATGTLSARNAMSIMGGAMGGVGIAVAGLGFAFVNQAQRLKAFTDQIINIDTKARILGIDGGALDNVVKQMRRMGVEDNKAIAFVEGVTKGIAELTTQGSKLNQFISTNIKTPENRERMDQFVANMIGFADKNDLEGMVTEFVRSADYVFDSEIAAGRTKLQASEKRNEYLKAFGLDPETAILVPRTLQATTDAQKLQYRSSLQASKDYNTEYNKLSEQFKGFNTAMKEAMLPAFTEINKMFAEGDIDAQKWGRAIGGQIGGFISDVAGLIKDIQATIEWFKRLGRAPKEVLGEVGQALAATESPIAAMARQATGGLPQIGPGAEITPIAEADRAGLVQAYQEEQATAPKKSWRDLFTGGLPGIKRQGGGAVAGGQPYMVGEGGPELFVPQGGGTIMPGFGGAGGGLGLLREQIDEMRDNTEIVNQTTTLMRDLAEEFKQLNDFLQPQGEGGQPEPRQYGGSAYKGRRYLVGERGPEAFLQRGGRARGKRPVVVGEKGPEVFVPDTSGEVISNTQAANADLVQERGLPTYSIENRAYQPGGPSASARNNNPGAQWPGSRAGLFGGETIKSPENRLVKNKNLVAKGAKDPYDYISFFPTPVHGLASNMETFYRRHLGKTVGEAMESWSGGLRKGGELGKYGYNANDLVTPEMVNNPDFWTAMAETESGKKGFRPSRDQLADAIAMREAGGAEEYAKLGGRITQYTTEGKRIAEPEGTAFTGGGGGEFGGGGATSTFDSAELDRGEVDRMMGGEISTVKGTGTIDVNVGGGAAGRRNGNGKNLLKDVRIERVTQMQPAEAGPSGTDTTAESA